VYAIIAFINKIRLNLEFVVSASLPAVCSFPSLSTLLMAYLDIRHSGFFIMFVICHLIRSLFGIIRPSMKSVIFTIV